MDKQQELVEIIANFKPYMQNIGPEIAVWLSVGVKRPTRLSGRRHVYLHRLHMTHTREYS
jgi:hypothetical protein